MTKKEMGEFIEETIKKLEDKEMINKKRLSPFQKTEKLLYELKFLKGAIDAKNKLIESLKLDPVIVKKNVEGVNVKQSIKFEPEIIKIETRIEQTEEEIKRIKSVIDLVETALDSIKDSRYYKIIELKYFDDMTHEYIAEKLNITERTVIRNKNYMIRQLQLMIFSNEVIKEIL